MRNPKKVGYSGLRYCDPQLEPRLLDPQQPHKPSTPNHPKPKTLNPTSPKSLNPKPLNPKPKTLNPTSPKP